MPRHWKEPLDPARHVDHHNQYVGGLPIHPPRDRLISKYTYFVAVPGFTFEFQSLLELETCLRFFSQKLHPSSIEPKVTLEHYWRRWFERLPLWLFEEPKRQRVVRALSKALAEFQTDRS